MLYYNEPIDWDHDQENNWEMEVSQFKQDSIHTDENGITWQWYTNTNQNDWDTSKWYTPEQKAKVKLGPPCPGGPLGVYQQI